MNFLLICKKRIKKVRFLLSNLAYNDKGEKVKRMINLIKEVCINQLQIETMLDTPIKLSQIIKNKGKKAFSEDIKADSQTKLMK